MPRWRVFTVVLLTLCLGLLTVAPAGAAQSSKPGVVKGSAWHLRSSLTAGPATASFTYGRNGDFPLMCDWNGNGRSSPAVVRVVDDALVWHIRQTSGRGSADITISFGDFNDVPVCGDWNGDGVDSPGVVRANDRTGRLRGFLRSNVRPTSSSRSFVYGRLRDDIATFPVVGDWNGNGVATPGWFRDGRVYLRTANSPGPPNIVFDYGRRGDVPVVGDWNGDGRDTVGVRRGATWYLTNRNARGAPAATFNYGWASDVPMTGDWNRNGQTTPGVVRGSTWYLSNRNSSGVPAHTFRFTGW
jgi:hypothetical protein